MCLTGNRSPGALGLMWARRHASSRNANPLDQAAPFLFSAFSGCLSPSPRIYKRTYSCRCAAAHSALFPVRVWRKPRAGRGRLQIRLLCIVPAVNICAGSRGLKAPSRDGSDRSVVARPVIQLGGVAGLVRHTGGASWRLFVC